MALYKEGLAFGYIQGTKYHRDKPLKDRLGPIPAVQSFKKLSGVGKVPVAPAGLEPSGKLVAMFDETPRGT